MTYRYNGLAEIELYEAAHFYENRAAGLGSEFLDEVDRGIATILQSPTRWPDEGGGIRRCRLHRFPYALFYRTTSPDEIEIVAVANLRRRPGYWRNRV